MHSPRLVRRALAIGAFAACLTAGGAAHAQFANHSIGFEAAGVFVANPDAQNVGSGGQVGIDATLYIESGVELYFRALVGIHHAMPSACIDSAGHMNVNGCEVVGVIPAVGFRYLFSEESVRPYLGLTLGYLAFFTSTYDSRFSISPMGGLEFFVSENFSVGIQAEYHLMLELGASPAHAVLGLGKVGWYF